MLPRPALSQRRSRINITIRCTTICRRSAKRLRIEYEAIVQAGFVLQIDAPDLALERHISYKDKPIGEFLAFVEAVITEINRALQNVAPDRVRLHVCWGNSEIAARLRRTS